MGSEHVGLVVMGHKDVYRHTSRMIRRKRISLIRRNGTAGRFNSRSVAAIIARTTLTG